jgi:hypothetical protein
MPKLKKLELECHKPCIPNLLTCLNHTNATLVDLTCPNQDSFTAGTDFILKGIVSDLKSEHLSIVWQRVSRSVTKTSGLGWIDVMIIMKNKTKD